MLKETVTTACIVVLVSFTVARADLLVHYTFDEGSGTTAGDSAGSDHNGAFSAEPGWTTDMPSVPGGNSYAVGLLDANQTLSTADEAALDSLGSFTIALWIKDAPVGFSGSLRELYPRIVEKNDENDFGYVLHANRSGGQNRTDLYLDWPNGAVTDFTDADVEGWHHWAWVYDGAAASEQLKMYLDGTVQDSADLTGVPTANSMTLNVASSATLADASLSNLIDDFRLYNEPLDQEAIQALVGGSSSLPGDLNGDGFVGGADLDIVRSFWGQTVTAGNKLKGDPSGDGFVGGDDLDEVRAHWGEGTPPAPDAVPEPATFVMFLAGAICALGMRIRRSI